MEEMQLGKYSKETLCFCIFSEEINGLGLD